MKPIFVHVHIYYPEMWSELKDYLKNLEGYSYDLYVTCVENHHEMIEDVKAFKPDAKIEIVENKGFDVGPFIHVLNQIKLDDYSYLIKLHTKRDMKEGVILGQHEMSGERWRKYLLSFLEKQNFEKCLSAFEKDKQLGMCGSFRLIQKKSRVEKENFASFRNYVEMFNLKTKEMRYVAGTMFIVRASLFQKIKDVNLEMNDFETTVRSNKLSLAHALERILCLTVIEQGYKLEDVYTPKWKQFIVNIFSPIKLFVYRKKVDSKGKVILKILKIPFRLQGIKSK